jgi:NitT/TauT family transport system substrate-binding protein
MMNRARLLALTATALVGAPQIVRAQTMLPGVLRIGGTPNDDMTPVVYAKQAGIFTKYGLNVELEKSSSGSAAAVAIAGGAYDIAKSSISSIFDAHLKGIGFTILTPAGIYDSKEPYGGFLIAQNSPIKTGKDCNGGTFGVASLGSVGRVALAKWIDQTGGDASTVKFVEIPFTAVTGAIQQGRILAGETAHPAQAQAIATGNFKLLPAYDAIAPYFIGAVYYTMRDFSLKHPEVIKAFVKGFYESAAYTNAHPEATAKMMADFSNGSLETYLKMPRVKAGNAVVLSQIQPAIDAAAKYGTLERSFSARELIDPNITAR